MASNPASSVMGAKVGGVPVVAIGGIGILAVLLLSSRRNAVAASGNNQAVASGLPPSMAYNQPLLIPAGATATSGNGGLIGNPQTTEPLSKLLGGKSLNDFFTGLGPDYTGASLTEGGLNVSVGHHNSAADLALLSQAGANANSLAGITGKNTTDAINATGFWGGQLQDAKFRWEDILGLHSGTVLNPGQTYVPPGTSSPVSGMPTNTVSSVIASIAPTMAASPPPPPPPAQQSCPPGNFSCIRYACSAGNYSCARSVAGWLGNNKVW